MLWALIILANGISSSIVCYVHLPLQFHTCSIVSSKRNKCRSHKSVIRFAKGTRGAVNMEQCHESKAVRFARHSRACTRIRAGLFVTGVGNVIGPNVSFATPLRIAGNEPNSVLTGLPTPSAAKRK